MTAKPPRLSDQVRAICPFALGLLEQASAMLTDTLPNPLDEQAADVDCLLQDAENELLGGSDLHRILDECADMLARIEDWRETDFHQQHDEPGRLPH